MHSSTRAASTPACCTARLTASAPNCTALSAASPPWNFPTGVLTALTITTSLIYSLLSASRGETEIARACLIDECEDPVISQTFDVASGMHARHSPYYIRRIRISATDSLFKFMRDAGVPYYPEVGQDMETANTYVLEFPVKAPDGAVCKDDLSALDQLAHWKLVKENFTEHNPSVTVSVGDDEWISVANWVYANWEMVGGLSFLPRENHAYRLAPYEAVTKERYEELARAFPEVDYGQLMQYERQDETELKKELACVSGTCDVI